MLHQTASKVEFNKSTRIENILADPYVEVSAISRHFNIDDYELTHLKFVETGKNKRKTYDKFVRKYARIAETLVKNQILPREESMIHTPIQMNFINRKKMWEFSRVFVVYSDPEHLEKVLNYLEPYKLIVLKERLIMGYLNEKLAAIKAFTAAKSTLENFLKKHSDSNLEIGSVFDIEIKGRKLANEEDIEDDLIKEHNKNSMNEIENDANFNNKQKKSQRFDTEYLEENVAIKVIFKVNEKSQEARSKIEEELEEDEEENESEDSEIKDADLIIGNGNDEEF